MLAAGLPKHLADEAACNRVGNHRNGSSPKAVFSSGGARSHIPRNRLAIFDPQPVSEVSGRLPGFDNTSLACTLASMFTPLMRVFSLVRTPPPS